VKHAADHITPAILYDAAGPHPDQTFDVSGGWWDAGDYGRYVPPAATTLMSLFYAYHFNPVAFQDGSLNIPESGNGVSDLLDEARWELEWLLKMQRADGAVHQKVTTADYAEGGPEADTQPLYLYDVSTQATAQYAGAIAEASLVYREVDPEFADKLLAAAIQAWAWLEAQPGKYPEGGYIDPENHYGGPYSIEAGDETGQRLWAAGSLFHATGEAKYANAFADLWAKRDPEPPVYGLSWATRRSKQTSNGSSPNRAGTFWRLLTALATGWLYTATMGYLAMSGVLTSMPLKGEFICC
jgi:endoglucanase